VTERGVLVCVERDGEGRREVEEAVIWSGLERGRRKKD
jgi:hypothetical protein